ncbi:MAG: isoprenyl transferase [Pseudomonadota bacterium]
MALDIERSPKAEAPLRAVPQHVAVIMDGNGRWAKARGLPRRRGHQMGVEALRRCVKAAIDAQVNYLTVFSFSSENWSRPAKEIDDLMGLIKVFIRRDLARLHGNGVRVTVIGERDDLESEMRGMIDHAETLTQDNTTLNLVVAFNYGARNEIARAAKRIAVKVARGELDPADIDLTTLDDHLDTRGIPDPELLIRTSGEQRLSNFLLWQSAYTEFVFQDIYWPDFGEAHFLRAIDDFQRRDRRFGGTTAETVA